VVKSLGHGEVEATDTLPASQHLGRRLFELRNSCAILTYLTDTKDRVDQNGIEISDNVRPQ
jgi:hypothetical protein